MAHLHDFAHHLIGRHGPRTAGEIWHAYSNVLGNYLATQNDSVDAQKCEVREALNSDDRFAYDSDTDTFSHKPAAQAQAEDAHSL